MLYTETMQTKIGVHYHVKAGPDVVQLYNSRPFAGPFYDLVLDDMDEAHELFVNLVDLHLPEYLDEDDKYESYEYVEYMRDEAEDEFTDVRGAHIGVEQVGLNFELLVCTGCVPKGMN